MTDWITSDLHFGHKAIIRYCNRPYKDIDEMDEAIIHNWNSMISKRDTVYILGDISFRPSAETVKILKRLEGIKILIKGNHDKKLVNCPVFRREFWQIYDYLEVSYTLTGKKLIPVILCHYPIAEWNGMHKGSVHFHGHLHGNPSHVTGRIKDVSIDTNNMFPYNLKNLMLTIS